MTAPTPIALFLLHWNRPEECARTVRSFLDQAIPLRITIVDNNSDADAYAALRARLSDQAIRWVRLDTNLGWGRAFNRVLDDWLDDGDDPFCLVSAHDTLLAPGCLDRLLSAAISNPDIGLLSPEYGVHHLPKYSPIRGPRLLPVSPRPPGKVECCDFCHGTLTLFRRDCLHDIGTYDPHYFAYGDETEIGIRATRRGWKAAVAWGARIDNPGTWTPRPLLTYLFTRNSLLLASKHGGYGRALLRAVLILGNTVRLRLSTGPHGDRSFASRRLLGVRDFLIGRSGRPASTLFEDGGDQ